MGLRTLIIICVVASPLSSLAQWSVSIITPAGATASGGYAFDGATPYGFARIGDEHGAGGWAGPGGGWESLHPDEAEWSSVFGARAGMQVGFAAYDSNHNAAMWMGSKESYVNLHPAGAWSSTALATDGKQQVGVVSVGGVYRPALWHGNSNWIDLTPRNTSLGFAYAVDDGVQGGYVWGNDGIQAAVWRGSAATYQSMRPADAKFSGILDIRGSQYVGYYDRSAAIWLNHGESVLNIHPGGFEESWARATTGEFQVGATWGDRIGAAFWAGSAASFFDLHSLLPNDFVLSEAFDVRIDASGVWVLGVATTDTTQVYGQAVLWHNPVPEPATATAFCLGVAWIVCRHRT